MFKKIIKSILPAKLLNFFVEKKNEAKSKADKMQEENSEEFILRKNFYAQFLKKGDIYFDIGANYGNRISPIEKLEMGLIVAVGPQKKCCDYLRKKYKNITVLQKGVGAFPGKQTFYLSDESVLSSFSTDFIAKTGDTRFSGNTWNNTEEIEIVTLDNLIQTYGVPNFVKVDVEGFEPEVFKGLSVPLKVVSFEYTVPELLGNLHPIVDKLALLGNCKFNYSIGESMAMHLNEWVSYSEIKNIINSESFVATGFGDVYAKFI